MNKPHSIQINTGPIIPANIIMNNVEAAYAKISTAGTRQYYKCTTDPTTITGLAESHFKGVAAFDGKFIFSHTNLELFSKPEFGKYLLADTITPDGQGVADKTYTTAHKGWHHPCGEQACGSFLALGIQETADGGGPSEIQIYDTRNIRNNLPMQLIGTIKRPTGINGVAMAKETGENGRYIVAGINGTTLTLYRSKSDCLLSGHVNTNCPVEFDEVGQLNLDVSGPGIALVTQKDGSMYLFALDADDAGSYNTMFLYKLGIHDQSVRKIGSKEMPVPGLSGSITDVELYITKITELYPAVGKALLAILELGSAYLNSSFRWGKGLTITSADTIEAYATDRNILPLSKLSISSRDFSIVTWR